MEAELLAGVIQTETHKRLQIAEQLLAYFQKENSLDEFPDFEHLIGGLSSWIGSSNFKVTKFKLVMHVHKASYIFLSMCALDFCEWYADCGGDCEFNGE